MSSCPAFVDLLQSVGFQVIQQGTADIQIETGEEGALGITRDECQKHKGNFYEVPRIVTDAEGNAIQFGNDTIFVFSEVEICFKENAGNLAVMLTEWDGEEVCLSERGYIGVTSKEFLNQRAV